MSKIFSSCTPTRLIFGAGSFSELEKQEMPGKKAMFILGGSFLKDLGIYDRAVKQLENAGVESILFDKFMSNPIKELVEEGGAFARDHGIEFLVAIGGGSAIDTAKAIAVCATSEGDLWTYVHDGTGLGQPIVADPLPIIAIPTTAGTGSEMDGGCVITKSETQEKNGLNDQRLFPKIAIVDPELMTSVPPILTAYQGFDAMFHATEAYISTTASYLSDIYALAAIENASKYIVRAVKNGSDLEAREHVALASTLSGMIMSFCGTSAKHSLEHAISGFHPQVQHGAGLLMIAKAFYEFLIEKHACDDKFVKMAQVMGKTDAQKPEEFVEILTGLMKECGVDNIKMSDYGITPDEFLPMTKNAKSVSSLFKITPYDLSDEDCVEIFKRSYQ